MFQKLTHKIKADKFVIICSKENMKKAKEIPLKKQLETLSDSVAANKQALEPLKELPEKFNQLLEMLKCNTSEVDSQSIQSPSDIEGCDDTDPILNLIDKSKVTEAENIDANEDQDMMEVLNGIQPAEELGPEINKDVCKSISKLFTSRYPKPMISKIKEQFLLPSNCKELGVPKINREIWPILPPKTKQTDFASQLLQQNVSTASIIATKLAEKLFTTKEQ